MTLLTVVKDVCATVGVQVPQTVFGGIANNRTMQEMLALANEMAQRIAYDTRDWTAMRNAVTFTGDGVQTAFNLPAEYKRMLLTGNVRKLSSPNMPLLFIPDYDEWIERRLSNITDARGEWIITDEIMTVWPALGVGDKVMFPYIRRNPIRLASGGNGEAFMSDDDRFRLDERLLKLGMIWQWKAQKGSPYAEDMGSYSDALANAMGRDQPAPIIIDRRPISHTMRHSYPWPVPT